MNRKTALMTGIAAAMVLAVPAFASAQDMAPAPAETQTAPATAPAPATPPAQPGTLQLQPGSDVTSSDGTVIGKLEGVRTFEGAQQLTVRGTDGQLRGVPLGGLKPEGTGVVVGWTAAEYTAAPSITGAAPAPAATAPTTPPAAADPAMTEPMTEPMTEAPAAPPPPPTLPEDPAEMGSPASPTTTPQS